MTDRPQLLDRRLLFVTGKGGVGKTSIAAALGFLAAAEGRRTLLCEVDSKGNLADFFGLPPLRFTPTPVRDGLWAMAMDTESLLMRHGECSINRLLHIQPQHLYCVY